MSQSSRKPLNPLHPSQVVHVPKPHVGTAPMAANPLHHEDRRWLLEAATKSHHIVERHTENQWQCRQAYALVGRIRMKS